MVRMMDQPPGYAMAIALQRALSCARRSFELASLRTRGTSNL